jgi:hypothetical protein
VPADTDEGSFERVEIGGKPAALFRDPSRLRLVLARGDVLVTVEGNVAEAVVNQIAERIR